MHVRVGERGTAWTVVTKGGVAARILKVACSCLLLHAALAKLSPHSEQAREMEAFSGQPRQVNAVAASHISTLRDRAGRAVALDVMLR